MGRRAGSFRRSRVAPLTRAANVSAVPAGGTGEMATRNVDEIERIRTPAGASAGVRCSELDADAFRALGVAVTEQTLAGGVGPDQEQFWAWASQLFAGATKRRLDPAEAHRRELFGTCFRATAARADGGATAANRHAYYLAASSGGLLEYLCIPLLKALLTHACRRFVASDGAVLKMFYVKGRGLPYTPVGMGRSAVTTCAICSGCSAQRSRSRARSRHWRAARTRCCGTPGRHATRVST